MMNISNSRNHGAWLQEQRVTLEDDGMESERAGARSRYIIFGVALACGISLAAIGFLAALAFELQDTPPNGIYQETTYYLLYYTMELLYAARCVVFLSSVAAILTLLVVSLKRTTTHQTTASHALIQTILFQGGFFAGMTLTFALIQHVSLFPSDHPESNTFVATFVDPVAVVVVVVKSCFFLRRGGEVASARNQYIDDNEEKQIPTDSIATQGNDGHYYIAMVV